MNFHFDVFISYSNAIDRKIATSVQKGLEQLGKPVLRMKMMNVFLDKNNLSASSDLSSEIENALQNSKFLIILASPSAAKSNWVGKEIQSFLTTSSINNILIGLTEGSIVWDPIINKCISNSLPQELIHRIETEPKWVELRGFRMKQKLDLSNNSFKTAIAEFSSKILGASKEKLIRADLKKTSNFRKIRNSVMLVLVILLMVSGYLVFQLQSTLTDLKSESEGRRKNLAISKRNNIISSIYLKLNEKPAESLKMAEKNIEIHNLDPRSTDILMRAYYDNSALYRQVVEYDCPVNSLVISPNGKLIFTTGDKRLIEIDKNGNESLISSMRGYIGHNGTPDSVYCIRENTSRLLNIDKDSGYFLNDGGNIVYLDSLGCRKYFLGNGLWSNGTSLTQSLSISEQKGLVLFSTGIIGVGVYDINKKEEVAVAYNDFEYGTFSIDKKSILFPLATSFGISISPLFLKKSLYISLLLTFIS